MVISAADINLLTSIQFLNSPAVLNDIKAELPAYLAAAQDVGPSSPTSAVKITRIPAAKMG